jgi:hypothetical protein
MVAGWVKFCWEGVVKLASFHTLDLTFLARKSSFLCSETAVPQEAFKIYAALIMWMLIANRETENYAWSLFIHKSIPDLTQLSSISEITCQQLQFLSHCYLSPECFQLLVEAHICSGLNHNSKLMYDGRK